MGNNYLKSLFTLLLLLCSIVVSAYDFEVDGIYYNILSQEDKTVEVTYKETDFNDYYLGNVVIPASVSYKNELYSVVSIGGSAFEDCSGLTSIAIPNSVTSIGDYAFSSCSSLRSITIPNSVTSIGKGAFGYTALYKNQSDGIIYIGKVLYGYKGKMPENTSIKIKEGTVSISHYAFYDCSGLTSIEIPNSVTSIGESAFEDCDGLTCIEIPNSVTSIGNRAFSDCSGLTSITIPNSVTSIGNRAFYDCSGLTSIEIPNSVTSIGERAFFCCSSLTSIILSNSLTSIGDYAFEKCSALTSIEIPNSVTSIGGNAFFSCDKLAVINVATNNEKYKSVGGVVYTKDMSTIVLCPPAAKGSFSILDGVTSIGDYAFYYCSGLTSIKIPNSVTSIGDDAFSNCSGLTSIKIPNSVTSIGDYAFCKCSRLKSIEIPNSVTSIGRSAFSDCSALTSIAIPNSVTSIGERAFFYCSALTSIKIPNSVTSIGERAFYGCRSLTSITIPNSVISIGESAFEYTAWYNNQSDCVIYIGKILYKYNGKVPVNNTYVKIKEGTVSIYPSAFSGCSGLTSIEIPNSVTSIGESAFSGCSGLTSIEIPNSVTSIGESVFSGCSGLTSIEIPNSVTSIGESAFSDCRGLTSIKIPNSVTSIGERAFSGCSSLMSIVLSNSVTSIVDYVFSSCSSLRSITIPKSVTSIGSRTFVGCDELTAINVATSNEKYKSVDGVVYTKDMSTIVVCPPAAKGLFSILDGVTSIGDYAFYYCRGLTIIEIPNSVTSIGDYAFYLCRGLRSITIPNSVTSIGESAFQYCSNLTSIEIPNSVTSIGDNAFYYCSSLTSIAIPNSVISIGESAFYHCEGLTNIVIPNSVTSIGRSVFFGCSGLKSITIPNSVTSIGNFTFCSCSGLTSIVIPNSVTSIGDDAFSSCSGLTSIAIPNSVTSIGRSAFSHCEGLTSIEIPNSVTSIENFTFYECSSLTSIEIPNSVTSIGEYAFTDCNSLTSIEIPNSVIIIGRSAFENCSALTSIEIPNSVTGIGNYIFARCSSLAYIVVDERNTVYDSRDNCNAIIETTSNTLLFGCKNTNIPNSVTSIGDYAFSSCSGLTSIEIPNSVIIIGMSAFENCSALTSIEIPNSVTTIGYEVFRDCSGLTSIVIPNSVTSIDSYAFRGCSSLTKITSHIPANELFKLSDNTFANVDKTACTLYVPYGAKNKYATTAGWKDFKNIVEFRNTYKATFIVGDKEFATVSILEGDTITYPEVPQKDGYTLKWEPALEIMPSNDITIIGRYVVNKYLLIYKVDDEVYASDSIDYGATIEPIAEPAKKGHTFSGWSDIPATMPAEDVIIEGNFSVNKYLFTYKVDGAVYASDSIDYGASIEPIAEPTKEGHTFSGWSDIPATMPAEDVVIEGSFSINSYTVTFMVDGEVYETITVEYGATIEPIAEPTKEGHTFSGWSDIPATMPAEDVVVEGSFSINKYLLTYKVDGAVYASDSIDYGATIEPIAEPTKEGHTFSGWSDIPATMPAEDVVVEGSFSINSYTVTFMVDGEVYETITVEYGATIEPIEAPTKVGHTFKGWSDIPATMPAEDIVVEANFAVNSYAVILMIDGNLYKIITVEYGAEIELPTPPEKEGSVFTGWIDVPATMPAEDIIIEGSYKVNTGISAVGLDLEKNEVYNLKGQRVTESENLTRGIYIVNGKKVYVK